MTLEEIAVLLGFADASHLSKHFVEKVGITPNKYRKIYSKVKSGYNRADKKRCLRSNKLSLQAL